MLCTSIHTPIQPYMPTNYTPEFIPSTGESTHLSEQSVISRWISPRHSIFITKVECEWMGGMNEHVVCACGISTTEWITGESTRCAPLFLVSITCHLALSLSRLFLFRDIELFITWSACSARAWGTSTAIFYPPPLYRACDMDSSTHIAVERVYVLYVPLTFLNCCTAIRVVPSLSTTYSQLPSHFLYPHILPVVLRRVARKWPHGNQLRHCLYRLLSGAGRLALKLEWAICPDVGQISPPKK